MMKTIDLFEQPGPQQFRQWRVMARMLLLEQVPPDQVKWLADSTCQDFFTHVDAPSTPVSDLEEQLGNKNDDRQKTLRISRAVWGMMERIACHTNVNRFDDLYAAVWRLSQGESALWEKLSDPLVQRLKSMDNAIRREMHKTKAFIRFTPQKLDDGGRHHVAWFEPQYYALELVAPFFQQRFAHMSWTIMTPKVCLSWDGVTLHRSRGVPWRPDIRDDDDLRDAWSVYYTSTFNPARLKVKAMVKEMPKYYWRNLPEASLIPDLVARAEERTSQMLETAPTVRHAKRVQWIAPDRSVLDGCTRCPHALDATQAVHGVGLPHANIMVVCEQPEEASDLCGDPWAGSRGAWLEQNLKKIGILRTDVYLTYAVKHFYWQVQRRQRRALRPDDSMVSACQEYLFKEIKERSPQLILAIGRIAGQALCGLTAHEMSYGDVITLPSGHAMMMLDNEVTSTPRTLSSSYETTDTSAGWQGITAFLDAMS